MAQETIVVTGGTRGIGAGVATVLHEAGYHVIAASVSQAEIDAFDGPDGIQTQLLDVTDNDQVTALFGGLSDLHGLVNCAGILIRNDEYDIEVFQKVIDVNLTGTMRCCLAAHPHLARNGGAIVNTASMLSTFGGPLVPAYSASKGGVAQLTKALAAKWADDGVRVNAVAPGWIETEMTQALRDAPEREAGVMARTPMKRWGKTREVGALAKWLLSSEASFVTGAVYPSMADISQFKKEDDLMSDAKDTDPRMPYQLPFPKDALDEIVVPNAIPEDERIWVPQPKMSGFARFA